MKSTGKTEIEIGQRSATESAGAAARHFDFEDLRSPNKSVQTMAMTLPPSMTREAPLSDL